MRALQALLNQACGASAVLLYLDYDGTLAPLRSNPGDCALIEPLPRILGSLSGHPRLDLAVISGRSLNDLSTQLRIDLSRINLAGNHGLEVLCRGEIWVDPRAELLRPQLDQIAATAQQLLGALPGAWIEHKGLSLSLHERAVSPDRSGEMRRRLDPLISALRRAGKFQISHGRSVLEIRPAFAHGKAFAAEKLEQDALKRGLWMPGEDPAPLRLYFGDDLTDEDVFLHWSGVVGIHVGPAGWPTAAVHRLGGPAGLCQWLTALEAAMGPAELQSIRD